MLVNCRSILPNLTIIITIDFYNVHQNKIWNNTDLNHESTFDNKDNLCIITDLLLIKSCLPYDFDNIYNLDLVTNASH